MQNRTAKEQRLVKTMAAFFKARKEEKCCLLNGRMPTKQAKVLQSIIKQAAALQANTTGNRPTPEGETR